MTQRECPQLYLYKISQSVNTRYDTFDAAIVAAETAEAAQKINPMKLFCDPPEDSERASFWRDSVWTSPENVSVELIGTASEDVLPGLVLASFNAG